MTYIIKRFDRRYGNKIFGSYEEARSYVRKTLRKKVSRDRRIEDWGFFNQSNPSPASWGFSIARKAA